MAKLSSSNGKKANVPKLRFPEFSEEWEEISFSNLFDFLPNNTITRANLSNNGAIRNIHYGDVLIKFGSVLSIRSDDIPFIKNTDTVNNNVFLKNGDIVIAGTAEDETVGKVTEIFDIDTEKVVSGLHTIPCRPKKNFAPKFLGYYMNSPAYHYQLFPLMQGVKVLSISKSNIVGTVIHYPDILQQTKITNLLSLIDKKISVQRQLVEALKKYKRGSLSALFPKKREITPQYRFAGFTNHWEQRKLDNITDVRDGTHDSPQYVENGHPFITSKNVKDGYINYEDVSCISDKDYEEINKRSKVDKNDILMGMIGTIGNIALVREIPDFAIKNVALIKDTGNVFYRYLYHCLQSNSIAQQLGENLDGGTQKFIALNKIRELNIPVPTEDEQHKIGDYMEQLDSLITLHQHKYDILLSLKNALLQQMFI